MSVCPVLIQFERPVIRHHLLRPHGPSLDDYLFLKLLHNARRLQNDYEGEVNSTIKEEKNKFQVNLDIQHFAPEEISVKTADGYLLVEAKHEEKADEHGYISRSFMRRYALPEDIDLDNMSSKLSSDGVLTISAPLKKPPSSNERVVPVIQTGPVTKQVESSQE